MNGQAGKERMGTRRLFRSGTTVGALGALGALFAAYSYVDPFYLPSAPVQVLPEPTHSSLRVMTLNLAHGRSTSFHQALTRDRHIRTNLDAIGQLIRDSKVDVVTLQELDAASLWSGNFDHLAYLGQASGLEYSFHGLHVDRSIPKLAYGTGVLSRFPIIGGESETFSINMLDTKGFALVTLESPLGALDIVSVHLDFKRDSERSAQLELLSEAILRRQGPRSLVVAGDFNTSLQHPSSPLHAFVERHALQPGALDFPGTFPSHAPTRHIDYLFTGNGCSADSRWVLADRVSDHRAVIVDIRVDRQ